MDKLVALLREMGLHEVGHKNQMDLKAKEFFIGEGRNSENRIYEYAIVFKQAAIVFNCFGEFKDVVI